MSRVKAFRHRDRGDLRTLPHVNRNPCENQTDQTDQTQKDVYKQIADCVNIVYNYTLKYTNLSREVSCRVRGPFSIVFVGLVLALIYCIHVARRSKKAIGPTLAMLLCALIPPVSGNLIITVSSSRTLSVVGYYIYFLGMNAVMFSLMRFTEVYCRTSVKYRKYRKIPEAILVLDSVQMLSNPFFHHVFDTKETLVDGYLYYRLVPLAGQTFHRVVDYSIFLSVLLIFAVRMARTPRFYVERYAVILMSMAIGGLWQSYYIFSGTPVDRSMIGFAVFGLLVFYFSLYYRPLRLLDRMLAMTASNLPEALFFYDGNNRCIWGNMTAQKMAEVTEDMIEEASPWLQRMFNDPVRKPDGWSEQFVREVKGEKRYYLVEKRVLNDDRGTVAGCFVTVRDQTDEQLSMRRKLFAATRDHLTGLYNRGYFYDQTRELLDAHPQVQYLAVFLDINDFKIINDIFGMEFGDEILRQIARWISRWAGEGSLYGRLGGDTFGVCIPRDSFDGERIERELSTFEVRQGRTSHMPLIHVGVYEITDPLQRISVMMDRAHMALMPIKSEYHRHVANYDDHMRDEVLWSQKISSELSEAIATRQIVPYLQPIMNTEGEPAGAEALIRWHHPEEGLLSPYRFIPFFEKNGMIVEVDRYMWRSACEILADWKKRGSTQFISVNISPKDFYLMDVAEEITGLVREFDLDPSRLRIEITETIMMKDIGYRSKMLRKMQEQGFLIEMDDFGSGYSSLNLLKDMPVDVLKIDQHFLTDSQNDEKARTILQNVLQMTRSLGVQSLTEGVETREQLEALRKMGCRLFQGFYYSKPIPVEDFEEKYLIVPTQTEQ